METTSGTAPRLPAALPSLRLFGLCSFQRDHRPVWGWNEEGAWGGQRDGSRARGGAARWLISHLLLFGWLHCSFSLKYIPAGVTHPSSQVSNLR